MLSVDRVLGAILQRVFDVVVREMKIAPQPQRDLAIHARLNLAQLLPVNLGVKSPAGVRVRGADDVGNSVVSCGFDHRHGCFDIRCSVIQAKEKMVMNINHV